MSEEERSSASESSSDGEIEEARKHRRREVRISRLQRTSRKKGRRYKTDREKITTVLEDAANSQQVKVLIVQHPTHYPVEQMKQLKQLVDDNIAMMDKIHCEAQGQAKRDQDLIDIGRAVQSIRSRGINRRVMEWVNKHMPQDRIAEVKKALGLYQPRSYIKNREEKKLQRELEEAQIRIPVLEEDIEQQVEDSEELNSSSSSSGQGESVRGRGSSSETHSIEAEEQVFGEESSERSSRKGWEQPPLSNKSSTKIQPDRPDRINYCCD